MRAAALNVKSFLSAILVIASVASANASGGSTFLPSAEYLKGQATLDESLHPEGLPGGHGAKIFAICKDRIMVSMAMAGWHPDLVNNRANLNVCYSGAMYRPSIKNPPAYIQEQFYIVLENKVISLGINFYDGKCGFAVSTVPSEYQDQYFDRSTCKPVKQ